MSISFLVQDMSKDAGELDDREVSVSNRNGIDLLLALGLDPDDDGGTRPIAEFAALVTAALRRHLDHRSPELANRVDAQPGCMTITHLGRPDGYIEERLGDLARLVQFGLSAGERM